MASSAPSPVRLNLDIETLGREAYDPFAKALTVTDSMHRAAHDGFVYHTSGKVLAMIADEVDDFLIDVPAFTFPHFQRFRVIVGRGDIDMVVYEDTLTSNDGTDVGCQNTNRNADCVSGSTIYSSPTITDVGTLIHTAWIPPTSAGQGVSGATGIAGETNGEEWILKPSTKYLIRMTNNSGATIDYSYEILWYELDKVNL